MRRIVMAVVAVVALGAGPALADDAAPAKEAKGKELFLKNTCNSCHTIASQAIAKKAAAAEEKEPVAKEAAATKEAEPAAEGAAKKKGPPDLSAVGVDRKADFIVKYLQKLEAINGKKHMKKFKGTDAELTEVAAWLETLKDVEAAKKVNEGAAPAAKEGAAKEGEAKDGAAETAKETPKTE